MFRVFSLLCALAWALSAGGIAAAAQAHPSPAADAEAGSRLLDAIRRSDLMRLTAELQTRGNPDFPYPGLGTAMQMAADAGSVEVVDLLLRAGANINAPDAEGGTPFLTACGNRSPDFLRALIDRGANPRARRKQGTANATLNALHVAALEGNHAVIPYLASLRIDPSEADPATGATPLALAIAANCRPCAAELLKAGANARHVDPDGHDAAALCKIVYRRDFCDLL